MRLIDADSIKYKYAKLTFPDGKETYGYFAVVTSVEIKEQPTIEAEPVRHGEWVRFNNKTICSECKEEPVYANLEGYILTKRCPNCGAKMDGKEKE